MAWKFIFWDLDDEPDGNVDHISEHGFTKHDVEYVLANPDRHDFSRSSGLPVIFGYTEEGEYVCVVYEEIDDDTIRPVTAFPV